MSHFRIGRKISVRSLFSAKRPEECFAEKAPDTFFPLIAQLDSAKSVFVAEWKSSVAWKLLFHYDSESTVCTRVRQQLSPSDDVLGGELLTMEQVRRAANVVVESLAHPPRTREQLYKDEIARQSNHAGRNAQASKSHRKTRRKRLAELGIDPDKIKSIPPKNNA